MLFTYIFDNNEKYSEDHSQFAIFSLEKISNKEFESIVKDAFQQCEEDPYWEDVARMVIDIDDRFFLPQTVNTVFIGYEDDDYETKIRGFRHI